MFKEIIEYFKDNPEGYWFKSKIYGLGWTPVKWQGWLVVFLFVAYAFWVALSLGKNPTRQDITQFFIELIIGIVILILICSKKGEKLKWQWGIPKKKDE